MRKGAREGGRIGRDARQWEKSEVEEPSQVSVVRETSTEIAGVVPIFANVVFGEMQIHHSFDRWTSLKMYEKRARERRGERERIADAGLNSY